MPRSYCENVSKFSVGYLIIILIFVLILQSFPFTSRAIFTIPAPTILFGSTILPLFRQVSTVSPATEEVKEPLDRATRLLHKLNRSAFHLDEQPVLKKYENKQHLNPLNIVDGDLKIMNKNIRTLLSTNHTLLETIANYYFQLQGKKIRPVIILLMARALSHYQQFKKSLVHFQKSHFREREEHSHSVSHVRSVSFS